MFNVVFDVSFIEDSVFRLIAEREKRGEPTGLAEFYRERDGLYEIPSATERDGAFRQFYERMFREFGLRAFFNEVFSEFPLLGHPETTAEDAPGFARGFRSSTRPRFRPRAGGGDAPFGQAPVGRSVGRHRAVGTAKRSRPLTIFVKRVYTKKDEGAELFRDGHLLSVLVMLEPLRVVDQEYLKAFLRHELMHISDMLDPAFRYDPAVKLDALNETEECLIRERFRILWAFFIDARTQRKGFKPLWPVEKHAADFKAAFRFWTKEERDRVFDRLTSGELFTQTDLIEWSTDARLTKNIGEGGLLCPICYLPTHVAQDRSISRQPEVVQAIMSDRPDWTMAMGICEQCFDLYASRVKVA